MKYVRYTIEVDFVTDFEDPNLDPATYELPATYKELMYWIEEQTHEFNFGIVKAIDQDGKEVPIPKE